MAIIKKFCFCSTLETGAMITACFGASESLIILVSAFVYLTINNSTFSRPDDYAMLMLMSLLSSSFIKLLSCILLIIGITLKRAVLVLPWLITEMIGIIGLTGALFTFPINFALFSVVVTGFGIYFWICNLAYYQHLKSEANLLGNIRNSDEESLPAFTR